LHNTQIPTLAQWHSESGKARMNGFVEYYRDEQGWSAGPHLFVADDVIWVFTPLSTPGVHAPSWNRVAWGVELVGDYDNEAMPDALRENAVSALAALHVLGNLDPATLKLHKEDPLTTHKSCPGQAVDKAQFIASVAALMRSNEAGEHLADRLAGTNGR
jgi:hypothetical protein